MSVSVEDLAGYLGTSPVEPMLPGILADAVELVAEYLRMPTALVGQPSAGGCPERIRDLAVKTLGSELWARRNAPGGITQWGSDGQPVRLARDPMVSVRSLLAPYRGLGRIG